jgi:hypothetical protein
MDVMITTVLQTESSSSIKSPVTAPSYNFHSSSFSRSSKHTASYVSSSIEDLHTHIMLETFYEMKLYITSISEWFKRFTEGCEEP